MSKTQTLDVKVPHRDINIQVSEGGSGNSNLIYLHGFNGFEEWPSFLDEFEEICNKKQINLSLETDLRPKEFLKFISSLKNLTDLKIGSCSMVIKSRPHTAEK